MKVIRRVNLLLIIAFLFACNSNTPPPPGTNEPPCLFNCDNSTPLPTAAWTILPAPDAKAAVTKYLEALQKDDFETMYGLLAQESRDVGKRASIGHELRRARLREGARAG